MNGDNREAHRQIELEKMLRTIHKLMWEGAHADDLFPQPYPTFAICEMRKDVCEALGIRRMARES
jgi:hypothetical protein